MTSPKLNFAELFRRYRLRSEFENLSDFGDALAKKQLHFENSLFSHWQKGDRMPKDRALLLIILKIFVERGGLKRLKEANELFASAGHGYLTDEEILSIPNLVDKSIPFQPPRDIEYFVGREEVIREAKKQLLDGKHILIHGAAGIGKTALAIRLAHMLREDFPDGILWYRLDVSNIESILTSIASLYGQDISQMQDVYLKTSFVRSLLSDKKILIVFDNAEKNSDLSLLLPNSPSNSIITTSQYENLEKQYSLFSFHLTNFENKESNMLFEKTLGKNYIKKQVKKIEEISQLAGHIPLSIRIIAQQIKKSRRNIDQVIESFKKEKIVLEKVSYQNTNLFSSLTVAYSKLNKEQKQIFDSLGIFEGTDFSIEAIAYINSCEIENTLNIMDELVSQSLVEYSTEDRYRLHPFIKAFTQKQIQNISIYKNAAYYYVKYLAENAEKDIEPLTERENFIGIFNKCYAYDFWKEIIGLWKSLGYFMWKNNYWDKYEHLILLTAKSAHKHRLPDIEALCYIRELSWINFWQGNLLRAYKNVTKGLAIASKLNNPYLIAYAYERFGKISLGRSQYKKSRNYLLKALGLYSDNSPERITNVSRYIAEVSACLERPEESLQYIKSSLEWSERVKDKNTKHLYQILGLLQLGAINIKRNEIERAKDSLIKALDLSMQLNFLLMQQIAIYVCLIILFEKERDLIKVNQYLKKAKKVYEYFNFNRRTEGKHHIHQLLKTEIKESAFNKELEYLLEGTPL